MIIKSFIKSFDGTNIAYNYFKGESRDKLIVVVHGFWKSKDSDSFYSLSEDLYKKYDVVAIDQRGHGSSGGTFTYTSKEHEDIKAVIEYFKLQYQYIYLMGFSLGAASSIIEAAKYKNVAGVIAVCPPADFEKIENRFYYPAPMIQWFKKLELVMFKFRPGRVSLPKEKPIDLVGLIAPIPILIIHGENDAIVFKHHAQELFDKANHPKKLHIIKNGLHAEDLYRLNKAEFMSVVYAWFKQGGVL